MKTKQRGYALLLAMIFSVVTLMSTVVIYQEKNQEISENNLTYLVNETARQTTEFSLAVVRAMTGIGAAPGDILTVSDLKNRDLLDEGYAESIAFKQDIKAYYVTNPSNKNIVDVLIAIDNQADTETMNQYGFNRSNVKRFISDVVNKGNSIGYLAAQEAEKFYVGTISKDGRTLKTNNETVDVSHIGLMNINEERFGIYAKAPNQTGWWRLKVGPYLWQPTPTYNLAYRPEERIEFISNGASPAWGISNNGFSYYCPDNHTKIYFGEEKEAQNINIVADSTGGSTSFSLCIQSYKGTVNPKITSETYYHFMNPITSNDPEPARSDPNIWGRCVSRSIYYDRYPLNISYVCGPADKLVSLVNPMHIQGLNNLAYANSWGIANSNNTFRRLYLDIYKNGQHDFKVANQIFSSGVSFKIDDRYVQAYQMSGTVVTGGHGYKYFSGSTHNFNKFGAVGFKISNTRPADYVTVPQNYKDSTSNTKVVNVTIPTPYKN